MLVERIMNRIIKRLNKKRDRYRMTAERETATATKKVIKGKKSEHGKIEKTII